MGMKINWKIAFTVIIILLFAGVIISIALGNIDKINILNKTP